ncbi:phosphotransferase [Streptomyces chartreusis]|uniref:phosphotransferase n=1 Tax=Streptomyces chartreusis TaxID=1969 RepID=UPI002E7FE99A|nr:phosphotransferase [Streptomyces chartreusis]WUB23780.1 phosphotransferase [Streptomyces chartreusis]
MPHVLPEPGPLFELSADRIRRAAAEQWPAELVTLGAHVPSVTGYVRRVQLAGRELFAKDSVLGLSLVSVLRGVAGDGGRVRAAQAAYATSPTSLLAREAAQLRALDAAEIRVGRCAGFRCGVLFTEAVTGPSLLDLITKEPTRTADLMTGAVRGLAGLQSAAVVAAVDAAPIAERGIDTTFRRKFNGISGRAYVARLGADQLDERTRCGVVAVLGTVVARLLKLRLTPAPGPRLVVYGDLKPEHVLFPDGPDEHPVFIDPGLSRGGTHQDTAKLVSRALLSVLSVMPVHRAALVVEGIDTFTQGQARRIGRAERGMWLRRLLVTWLMDSVNILSTYLAAPAALPLPEHARAVVDAAPALCTILDSVSANLTAGTAPDAVWRLALASVTREAVR